MPYICGASISGTGSTGWSIPANHLIGPTRVVFDPGFFIPTVHSGRFMFPAHRGNYRVYLHEDDTAVVIKSGKIFLCVHDQGRPLVLVFNLISGDPPRFGHLLCDWGN